ncbi:MAG: asparaginase [Gemmatimonadota bacterium]
MTGPVGVRFWRGTELESVHAVHAALASAGRVVPLHGAPSTRAFLRSAAKPIQLIPLVEEGLVARYGFTDAEVAVMAASHSGEPFHVAAVTSILEKADLQPAHLQCGVHEPLSHAAALALRAAGMAPTPLHNNCSGNHAGLLVVCRALGWPLATYREPDHPLQERLWRLVAELADLTLERVGRATDGCGIPAFALPVSTMAAAYGRLAEADAARLSDRERAIGLIFDAMAAAPPFTAGTGRLCTDLMTRAGAGLIIKTGAEGVYCAALRAGGAPRGLALKVADGAGRAADVALLELLVGLGAIDSAADPVLAAHARPPVRNHAGCVVGHLDAWLPMLEVE